MRTQALRSVYCVVELGFIVCVEITQGGCVGDGSLMMGITSITEQSTAFPMDTEQLKKYENKSIKEEEFGSKSSDWKCSMKKLFEMLPEVKKFTFLRINGLFPQKGADHKPWYST